jgi:nicotinate dehydrogenase subunit B
MRLNTAGCASGTWIGRVSDHAAHGALNWQGLRGDICPIELKSYRSIGQRWQPSADLGVDPIEFRLRYLLNDARATDVLKAVAEKSQWRTRSSPALTTNATTAIGTGIAVTRRSGGYAAAVAEVEVNKSTGKVTVQLATLAHDCGLIVNLDGVKNQVEGNIVQGVSRALFEEVNFWR